MSSTSSSSSSSGINSNKRSRTQSILLSTLHPIAHQEKKQKKPSDSTNSRRLAFHAVYEEISNRSILSSLTDADVQKISTHLDQIICLFEEIQPIIIRSYTELKEFQSTVPLPIKTCKRKKRRRPKPTVNYTNKSVEDLLDLFLLTGTALKCRYADIACRTVSDDVLMKLANAEVCCENYIDLLKILKKRINKSSLTCSSSSASSLTVNSLKKPFVD